MRTSRESLTEATASVSLLDAAIAPSIRHRTSVSSRAVRFSHVLSNYAMWMKKVSNDVDAGADFVRI